MKKKLADNFKGDQWKDPEVTDVYKDPATRLTLRERLTRDTRALAKNEPGAQKIAKVSYAAMTEIWVSKADPRRALVIPPDLPLMRSARRSCKQWSRSMRILRIDGLCSAT